MSFPWLGQKVNKKIDAYGHDADDSGPDLCSWPRDDAASRQEISTPFSILIEFEATEYSYSIRFVFEIPRIFDSNEIPDSSLLYKSDHQRHNSFCVLSARVNTSE